MTLLQRRPRGDRTTSPSQRLAVTPWRLDPRVAHLTLRVRYSGRLRSDELRSDLCQLHHQGFHGAVTAALAPGEQRAFRELGFAVVHRLHLLHRPVDGMPSRSPIGTRRARRHERDRVLAVDHAAFEPFWQIDEGGLTTALTATRTARLRVADDRDDGVVGYAVCGRTGGHGYVQRLAVHPTHQGRGLGAGLLLDGLRWLTRRGAREVSVNTQLGNERSLRLYRQLGFELQRDGLAVLQLDFGALT
jgi:ribosomal protein S18 acetylase RimI-like enzyme